MGRHITLEQRKTLRLMVLERLGEACARGLPCPQDRVLAEAATPVNSLLPSISGIAQVGQTLTAHPGTWSGNPVFTWQWKKAGVNIAGATGKTYVPVVGDIAAAITVAVTATNSTGNATATSGATANVIAA